MQRKIKHTLGLFMAQLVLLLLLSIPCGKYSNGISVLIRMLVCTTTTTTTCNNSNKYELSWKTCCNFYFLFFFCILCVLPLMCWNNAVNVLYLLCLHDVCVCVVELIIGLYIGVVLFVGWWTQMLMLIVECRGKELWLDLLLVFDD